MEESLEKPDQAPQFGGKSPGRSWGWWWRLLCSRCLCPAPSPSPKGEGRGPGRPSDSVPDSLLHLFLLLCMHAAGYYPGPSQLPLLHTHTHTHTFISFNLSAEINFSIPLIIFFLFTFELSPICLLWPGNEVPPDEMLYSACDLARVV